MSRPTPARDPGEPDGRDDAARGLRARDFAVRSEDRPGWERGRDRPPKVGERVYCAGGEGIVMFIHGRTGDDSRLLEIHLAGTQAPFFAASSNVLVLPAGAATPTLPPA